MPCICGTERMSVTTVEPERALMRRVLPFFPIAAAVAFALGARNSDQDAAVSATIAIAIIAETAAS